MKFTSRGRYEILKKCVQAYCEKANNIKDMWWLFTIDNDDDTFQRQDFELFLRGLGLSFELCFDESYSKIYAINRDIGSTEMNWDVLLNISDDQFPIVQGYDDIIRKHVTDDLDCYLWFYDGHQKRINTQEILGRKYYERFGYIYYPEYKSFFCDDEATSVATQLKKLVKVDECIIQHLHPDCSNELHKEQDELYIRNEKHWQHDSALFNKRKGENYELFSKW